MISPKPASPLKDITHAITKTKPSHAQPPNAKKHKSQNSTEDFVEQLNIGQVPTPRTPAGARSENVSMSHTAKKAVSGRDHDEQHMLFTELRNTAQAMQQLGTMQSSSSRTSDISMKTDSYRPSYARPTVASTRRASNIGAPGLIERSGSELGTGGRTLGRSTSLLEPPSPSSKFADFSLTPARARSPRRSHIGVSSTSLLSSDDLREPPRSVPRNTRRGALSFFGGTTHV